MYDGTIPDYTADNLLFDIFRSQYTPEEVQMEVLKNYEELAGLNNYRVSAYAKSKVCPSFSSSSWWQKTFQEILGSNEGSI